MCVNSIGVARYDVERLFIINVAVKYKPEIARQGGRLQAQGLFPAREAQNVTPHCE